MKKEEIGFYIAEGIMRFLVPVMLGIIIAGVVSIWGSIVDEYQDRHTYIENPMDDGKICDVKSYERFGWNCRYLKFIP